MFTNIEWSKKSKKEKVIRLTIAIGLPLIAMIYLGYIIATSLIVFLP